MRGVSRMRSSLLDTLRAERLKLEKERANTSLLRYLNEQQAEMSAQSETLRALQERKERLLELMGAKAVGVDGGLTPEEIYDVARAEETKSKTVEALLDEVHLVASAGG